MSYYLLLIAYELEDFFLMLSTGCRPGEHFLNGKCYFLSEQLESWQDARKECQKIDIKYDLVYINNAELNEFLKQSSEKQDYWIGLNDLAEEGIFKWANNEELVYGKLFQRDPWDSLSPDVC